MCHVGVDARCLQHMLGGSSNYVKLVSAMEGHEPHTAQASQNCVVFSLAQSCWFEGVATQNVKLLVFLARRPKKKFREIVRNCGDGALPSPKYDIVMGPTLHDAKDSSFSMKAGDPFTLSVKAACRSRHHHIWCRIWELTPSCHGTAVPRQTESNPKLCVLEFFTFETQALKLQS